MGLHEQLAHLHFKQYHRSRHIEVLKYVDIKLRYKETIYILSPF
jgi:hypothetical protein